MSCSSCLPAGITVTCPLEVSAMMLQICQVPKYLTKDQAYQVFLDFLEKSDALGADQADQAHRDGKQDEMAKNRKSQELDFEGYGRFMLHLVDILGFAPLLEREARILRDEMERARIRCAVNYEFSYKTTAAPRTLPQVSILLAHALDEAARRVPRCGTCWTPVSLRAVMAPAPSSVALIEQIVKRARASEATIEDSTSKAHIKQLNLSSPLVQAAHLTTPRGRGCPDRVASRSRSCRLVSRPFCLLTRSLVAGIGHLLQKHGSGWIGASTALAGS